MSRLTRSTTTRFLKRFLKPCAIKPSISGAYGPRRTHFDLGFGAVLVEDGLDALLLAALDEAAGIPGHRRVLARSRRPGRWPSWGAPRGPRGPWLGRTLLRRPGTGTED